MANISSYLEESLLDHVLRNVSYTSPAPVFVGLVDDTATDEELEDGDLTNEITGYTGDRPAVSFTEPVQENGRATAWNDARIEFENMPDVTVAYAIVCDADTAGNILFWCPLDVDQPIPVGESFSIIEGDLVIQLD